MHQIKMYAFKSSLLILFIIFASAESHNKYSKEANQPKDDATSGRPFRMARINMIYEKAQKRMNANKLQTLFKDLKEQDMIEIAFKKLKGKSQDKEGLKEMEVRSKMNAILTKYDLKDVLEVFESEHEKPLDSNHQKRLFKDKNLDKLWTKAMQSEFSDEELKILKEEFQHYEEKLTEYHEVIDKVHDLEDKMKLEDEKWENSVERLDGETKRDKTTNSNHLQHLNHKHRELKSSFVKLQNKVSKHEELNKSRFFEEDDAERLWLAAQDAGFDETELDVVKRELLHFEHRIKKLHHLHGEIDTNEYENKYKETMEDMEENKHIKNKILTLTQQVEKLRSGIEAKIKVSRHTEL